MMRVDLDNGNESYTGRWLQEWSDRRVLLPGGVTLDTAQFPANAAGQSIARGGTVIGKKNGEAKFGPAAADDNEVYFLWKTVNITKEGELAEAVRTGLVFEALLPDAGAQAAPLRALLQTRGFQFGDYTGAGIDE